MTTTDSLVFNGSAETDGHYNIVGGAGNDTFTGGNAADTMNGNGGHDVFVYQDVSQSTGISHDKIVGFDATAEKFDLDVTVTGINTAFSGGKLTTANFDANLTAAVTAAHLAAGHAVLFTATSGGLAGHTFLVVDANGAAGYQAGQDYVMEISAGTHLAGLSTGDFI
jgi:Ca2+-binding RTX toxin-like protein